MRSAPFSKKIAEMFCVTLAAVPMLCAWWLSIRYAVNTKFLDQWEHAPSVVRYFEGTLQISDLFSQHTESRMFFPRLITIALAWCTNWDTRIEILFIHFLLFSIAFCLWCLLRARFSRVLSASLGVYVSVLLYSLTQWWNFLFGFQIALYLPNLCLLLALLALCSRLSVTAKLCAIACCSLVATYSYANGMLLWPLLFGGLLVYEGSALRARILDVTIFLLFGIVVVALYFLGYEHPGGHAGSASFLENSQHFRVLYTTWLGAVFSQTYDPSGTAGRYGGLLLILFLLCATYLVLRWRDTSLRRAAIAWVILGSYALGSGIPVALSRSGAGVEGMLASRYLAFSVYLAIAVLPLLIIVLRDATRYIGALPSLALQLSIAALGFFLVIVSCMASCEVLPKVYASYLDRRHGQSAIRLLPLVVEDSVRTLVNGQIELKNQAYALDKHGLLERPLLHLNDIHFRESGGSDSYGAVLRRSERRHGVQSLQGWSYLPRQNRVADIILVTYERNDGRRIPAAYAFTKYPRPVRGVLNLAEAREHRWNVHLHVPEDVELKVWSLNSETAEAYLIRDEVEEVVPLEVKEFVRTPDTVAGSLDSLYYQDNGWIVAQGWAYLHEQKRQADSVLFTVTRKGLDLHLLRFFPGAERLDVAHALSNSEARYAGWQARFRTPFPGALIEAWAYDADTGQAYLIQGAAQGFVVPDGPMLYDAHRLTKGPAEMDSKKRITLEGYSPRDVRYYY